MNKATHKRIVGLLIIVFAFVAFIPKDVFADDKCTTAQNELKSAGAKKYGIVQGFDDNDNYYLEMQQPSALLKQKGVTNPVFKITAVLINGQDARGKLDIGLKDTIKPGDKIIIPTGTLRIYAKFNNGTATVTFKLKPDGFEDPDLKEACGSGTSFEYEVSADYDYYDEKDPEIVKYDFGEESSSEYIMNIDCDNKTYKEGTFEYTFCADKKKAIASGAKVVKFGSKGSESHQMYADVIKDGPTSFKCKYEINRENQNIWKLNSDGSVMFDENGERIPNPDYYANTSYLIGEGTFQLSAGNYVYHVGDRKSSTYSEIAKCEVKCDEIVTIEYGQPVASHGGICFEYKVRVTSRVDCGYGKINKPRQAAICVPTPYCIHTYEDGTTEVLTQGGPSEDFDECIEKCDGGRYTDKCSNKCYKEVYGESFKLSQVSGYEIAYAEKVAYKYGTWQDASPNNCVYGRYSWRTNGGDRIVNEQKANCDAPQLAGKGYQYSKYKSGIPAKPDCKDSCGWYANGKRECLNPCASTDDGNDFEIVKDSSRLTNDDLDEIDRLTKNSKISKKKREEAINKIFEKYTNADGTTCNIVYYNSQSTYERYHKTMNADGNPATNGKAKAWVTLDKEANEKVYRETKERCKAAAKCNTTTAEFTISASYTDKRDGKTTVINYPYESKSDTIKFSKDTGITTCSKTEAKNNNTLTTILENDGCYNCVKGCDNEVDSNPKDCRRWYRTEWSFPGTWFSDKHQDTVFYVENAKDKSYSIFEYKFCLPWYVADVNEKWYNYYHKIAGEKLLTIKDQKTEKTCANGSKITCDTQNVYKNTTFTAEDEKNLTYNINASTRKFGFYEWDIDISCFYASYMEKEKCSCDGTGKTGDSGYRVKVVDLENLFPDSEANSLASPDKTGRDPGFNWSVNATQTKKDASYQSLPVQYSTWVQKKGYSVYSDEYLDYEVYLTKEKINEIKKQSVKYNVFEGTFNTPGKEETKSASTYQSDLIRKTLKENAVYPNYEALKCNNIGDHTKTADYSAKCADFTGEVK